MNYEQFIQSQIADIRAGRVFWCENCECWCPMDERRQDPWGGDWPVCIDCIEEHGLDDNFGDLRSEEWDFGVEEAKG